MEDEKPGSLFDARVWDFGVSKNRWYVFDKDYTTLRAYKESSYLKFD